MALFYVAHDLEPGQNYQNLWNELESRGAVRVLNSLWALTSSERASNIRNTLRRHIDNNDRLLVVQSTTGAWYNLMADPTKL
jgi:hypothetical protein